MGQVHAGMVMSLDGFVKGRDGNTTPLYPAFDDMMASDLMQEIIATTHWCCGHGTKQLFYEG